MKQLQLQLFGCLLVCPFWPSLTSATLISNVNLVFETFDPVSMVRFFEFNDKGWNISAGCIQDMFYYLDGLHRDISWAMRLYDASGYYAGGLLDGNLIRSGNPDLCRYLDAEHQFHIRTAATVQNHTRQQQPDDNATPAPDVPVMAPVAPINESAGRQPFGVRLVIARYTMHVDAMLAQHHLRHRHVGSHHQYERLSVAQTVCMPRSCGYDDLKQVMSYAHLPHMRYAAHVPNADLTSLRLIASVGYVLWMDVAFFVLCAITSLILVLMLLAALHEWCTNRVPNPKPKKTGPIPERFAFSNKTSFIAHIDIDKISKHSTICDTDSDFSRNLNGSDQLLDSLIINNFRPTNSNEKQDNIEQAKSLELQHKIRTADADAEHTKCFKESSTVQTTKAENTKVSHSENQQGIFTQLIASFSWQRNYRRLFDVSHMNSSSSSAADDIEYDLNVVGGLKVMCCLSIVLVHICVFLVHVSSNKRISMYSSFVFGLLDNGSITIDVFFFLSGISMAHIFYTTARIIDVQQICGAFDQMLLFASMIMYKLVRLTFPYLMVLIVLQLTMKHFTDVGLLDIPSEDHVTCQEHMWKNILYIDTFFPVTERCMVWSWYISLEAQMCLGASIILLLAQTHPRYASIISVSFFTSSIVASTILRYNHRIPNTDGRSFGSTGQPFVGEEYEKELTAFNGVYDQPWTRISPYLLGLCLGYILHRTKRALRMNIVIVVLGWLACACLLVGFALKQLFVDKLSLWMRAAVASTTHTVCSMILFWIVLASVSQHGGPLGRLLLSPRWRPFGKLTNCVLLVHPVVTRWLLLSMEHSLHVSESLLVIVYAGFVVLIYAVGFVLYMLFEAPFAAVFHILYDRNFR